MFDGIAPTYDALNHLLSFGIDRGWRRKVVKMACAHPSVKTDGNESEEFSSHRGLKPSEVHSGMFRILDVATGTGDLAIALARRIPSAHITGVDISENMLAEGRKKIEKLAPRIKTLGKNRSENRRCRGARFSGRGVRCRHRCFRSAQLRRHPRRSARDATGAEAGRQVSDPRIFGAASGIVFRNGLPFLFPPRVAAFGQARVAGCGRIYLSATLGRRFSRSRTICRDAARSGILRSTH